MNDYPQDGRWGFFANALRHRRLNRLLDRVAVGDKDAFAAFYDATASSMYGMALAAARDPSHAQEIVADVYVTAWAKAPHFDASKANPDQWLMSMVACRSGRLNGCLLATGARQPSAYKS